MSTVNYITLHEAVNYVHRLIGIRVPKGTLYLWSTKGKVTADGHRVKLKTTKRFGRVYTIQTWIDEFLERVG